MRAPIGDYSAALHGVRGSVEDHQALARGLQRANIPLETVAHVNGWHFGETDQATGGRYRVTDQSMHFQKTPAQLLETPHAESRMNGHRLLAHESHHATQHHVNGIQFEDALLDRHARGRVEGYAENGADRSVPGSRSAYDHAIAIGRPVNFSTSSYQSVRRRG
jgi:hypothetical protein